MATKKWVVSARLIHMQEVMLRSWISLWKVRCVGCVAKKSVIAKCDCELQSRITLWTGSHSRIILFQIRIRKRNSALMPVLHWPRLMELQTERIHVNSTLGALSIDSQRAPIEMSRCIYLVFIVDYSLSRDHAILWSLTSLTTLSFLHDFFNLNLQERWIYQACSSCGVGGYRWRRI